MVDFSQFHLLRPLWLLAALPAIALCIALWRRKSSGANWRRAIAPDLLEHLLDQRGERRQRWPWLLLLLGWLIAAVALAGPTWEKLPTPVVQQRDALVIVLDLSLSMYAEDVKPSRLQRARYKVLDILNRRHEGYTGLVAYSGDAHVVAPLTDDTATIANLVPALAPDMMPQYGSDPVAGITQAISLLHNAGFQRGRILLISDEITEADVGAIARLINDGHWAFSMLGVGTSQGAPIALPGSGEEGQGGFLKQQDGTIVVAQLHRERFEQLAHRTSGRYSDLRLDDGDLDALLPRGLPNADETRAVEREFDQWRERGTQLAVALLPLAALAFRRGWLLLVLLLPLSQPSQALEWRDLWQRPDQQGQAAMAAGDAKAAAQKFDDPEWRGSARYRAGDYAGAERDFQQHDSAESNYNRGNALARSGRLQDAIGAYDAALAKNPNLEDAKANRDLVKKLLEQQQRNPQSGQSQNQNGQQRQQNRSGQQQQQQNNPQNNQQQQAGQQSGQQNQDGQSGQNPPQSAEQQRGQNAEGQQQQQRQQQAQQNAQQEQQQQRQDGEGQRQADGNQRQQPSDQQKPGSPGDNDTEQREQNATEQWLRQIPDDPSGLLRRKFDYEHRQRAQEGAPRDGQQPLW